MPEYFIILIFIINVSFIIHKRKRVKLFKSKKKLLIFYLINLAIATAWDQFAIARGHWSFNEKYLLGPKIGFMPIEEFLFVIAVSYFGLTVYNLVNVDI